MEKQDMAKEAMKMAAEAEKSMSYIHSLEEPTQRLMDAIVKAIESGKLIGVEMSGLISSLTVQRQLQPIPLTVKR